MSAAVKAPPGRSGVEDDVRMEIADDLLLLAGLIDRELRRDVVLALWAHCYDGLLHVEAPSLRLHRVLDDFCQALTEIPTCFDEHTREMLRSDFLSIHAAVDAQGGQPGSAAPDTDGDEMRIPMATVRRWGERRGHPVAGWPSQADGDRLAIQLRYLACLIAADGIAAPQETVAAFLAQRLSPRVDRFGAAVASCCETPLYRTLAKLIAAYVNEVRSLFEDRPAPLRAQEARPAGLPAGQGHRPAHGAGQP